MNNKIINLYSKHTVYVPPHSSATIQLKYMNHNSGIISDDVSIAPDKIFELTKNGILMPVAIAGKNSMSRLDRFRFQRSTWAERTARPHLEPYSPNNQSSLQNSRRPRWLIARPTFDASR